MVPKALAMAAPAHCPATAEAKRWPGGVDNGQLWVVGFDKCVFLFFVLFFLLFYGMFLMFFCWCFFVFLVGGCVFVMHSVCFLSGAA